jgi:hypothetical protein
MYAVRFALSESTNPIGFCDFAAILVAKPAYKIYVYQIWEHQLHK